MKFVSFNVCGLKQLLGSTTAWVPERTYSSMFNYLDADVICFQETKLQQKDIDKAMVFIDGYTAFYTSSRDRKGYAGVSIYVKNSIGVKYAEEGLTGWLPSGNGAKSSPYRDIASGMGKYPLIEQSEGLELDSQGRALVLDLGSCVVIGLYCPANSQGNMEEFRDQFFTTLDFRIRSLIEAGRDVVVMGDINVAREPIDSAVRVEMLKKDKVVWSYDDWKYNRLTARIVNKWVEELELVDTTREIHPNRTRMFTCWNQLINARPANFGSRIDYIFASKRLKCTGADILADLPGSDHCPIWADLDIEPLEPCKIPPLAKRLQVSFGTDIKSLFAAGPKPKARVPQTVDKAKVVKAAPLRSKPKPKPKLSTPNIKSFFVSATDTTDTEDPKTEAVQIDVSIETNESEESETVQTDQAVQTVQKVQNAQNWQSIFKKSVPLCYHHEPCILQKARKPGPNKGRSFWSCNRPQGEENDFEFRCKYFEWA